MNKGKGHNGCDEIFELCFNIVSVNINTHSFEVTPAIGSMMNWKGFILCSMAALHGQALLIRSVE